MPSATSFGPPTTFLSPHRSPEKHTVKNAHLPVLVYRSCLPPKPSTSNIISFLEPNHWVEETKLAGTPHHTPSTHKCLAVFKGYGRLLLTKGAFEANMDMAAVPMGVVAVDLYARDVIVIPSGVVHRPVSGNANFDHIILYPKGNLRYHDESRLADAQGGTASSISSLRMEPLPDRDPIFGLDGPLVGIWGDAEDGFIRSV